MVKYAVLEDVMIADRSCGGNVLGRFDSEEEAERFAVETVGDLEIEWPGRADVHVVRVEEASLRDKEDWTSFSSADVLTTYTLEDTEEEEGVEYVG